MEEIWAGLDSFRTGLLTICVTNSNNLIIRNLFQLNIIDTNADFDEPS